MVLALSVSILLAFLFFSKSLFSYITKSIDKYNAPSVEQIYPALSGIWAKNLGEQRAIFKRISTNEIDIPISLLLPYLKHALSSYVHDEKIIRSVLIRLANGFQYDGQDAKFIISQDISLKEALINVIGTYNGKTRNDSPNVLASSILARYYPENDKQIYETLKIAFLKEQDQMYRTTLLYNFFTRKDDFPNEFAELMKKEVLASNHNGATRSSSPCAAEFYSQIVEKPDPVVINKIFEMLRDDYEGSTELLKALNNMSSHLKLYKGDLIRYKNDIQSGVIKVQHKDLIANKLDEIISKIQ